MQIVTPKIRCFTGLLLLAAFLLVAVAAPVAGSSLLAPAQDCSACDTVTPDKAGGPGQQDGQHDQGQSGECCDSEDRPVDPAVTLSPFGLNISCHLLFHPDRDAALPKVHLAIFVPPQS